MTVARGIKTRRSTCATTMAAPNVKRLRNPTGLRLVIELPRKAAPWSLKKQSGKRSLEKPRNTLFGRTELRFMAVKLGTILVVF